MAGSKTSVRALGGFTLTELLITVLVVVVLAGLAAPSLDLFLKNGRLNSVSNQLEADLQLARREAIRRNARVLVCPGSSTVLTCGTSWASGWFVCYDQDSNGTCDTSVSTDPNPIRTRGAIDSNLTLVGPGAAVGYTARFNANGSQGASGAAALAFTLKGTWTSSKVYCESISATGTIVLTKKAAGSSCP